MSKLSSIGTCDLLNTVKVQNWFVGFITKASVERFLKKVGEYLIYTEEKNGFLNFILSVRDNKQCHHFTLTHKDENGWMLDAESNKIFDTIKDLIQYYETNMLPKITNLFLVHPFQRPKWFLKNEYIAYDVATNLIGTGNFSDVYEGKLYGKISVALKIYHEPTSDSTSLDDAKESLVHEACLMSQFKHPNIVKFLGICYDVPSICLIMEQCTGGSLDNHLQQWTGKITTGERILYSLEAAKGMCYLQEKDTIHRDLASRNCLISKYGVIKISDFGLSLSLNEVIVTPKKQRVPIRWMAPETIHRQPRYSAKSDVWSYGVLLYEIFNNGIKPWPDLDVRQCATNIRRGIMPIMPDRTPKEIIQLVNKCWKVNVEKRCDFKYIVNKLEELKSSYVPPKIADLTIAKLKNVGILSEEEAKTQEEKDDSEVASLCKIVTERISAPERIIDAPATEPAHNGVKRSDASISNSIAKDEELRRKREPEQEMAILSDAILEYVAAEIKKLLSAKRKRKRKHKSKRKLGRKHRRSRASIARSLKESKSFKSRKSRAVSSESASKESESSKSRKNADSEYPLSKENESSTLKESKNFVSKKSEDLEPKEDEGFASRESEDSALKESKRFVSKESEEHSADEGFTKASFEIDSTVKQPEAISEEKENVSSEIDKEIGSVADSIESEASSETKLNETCQTNETAVSDNKERQNENASGHQMLGENHSTMHDSQNVMENNKNNKE